MGGHLAHGRKPGDAGAVHRHEVAEIDPASGQQVEQPFVDDVEQAEAQGLDAAAPRGDHHVDIALVEPVEQGGDGFRQVLAVRIHHHHPLRCGKVVGNVGQADGDCPLVADIAAQLQHHTCKACHIDRSDVQRLADGPVVDGDDVDLLTKRLAQFDEQARGGFDVLEYRRHHHQFRGVRGHAHHASTRRK
jgi:hypothetical protein